MKLNLGCGPKRINGYLSCDLYAPDVDIKCDCRSLPFEDGSVDELLFYHTIEHVGREDGTRALREIYRVLRPGGTLAIETPDRLKLILLIRGHGPKTRDLNVVEGTRAAQGQYYPNAPKLLDGVKGALGGVSGTREAKKEWHVWLMKRASQILQALEANDMGLMPVPDHPVHPGELHQYLWTAAELAQEMESIGFTATVEDPQMHGQRGWRDCRVVGVKPCA